MKIDKCRVITIGNINNINITDSCEYVIYVKEKDLVLIFENVRSYKVSECSNIVFIEYLRKGKTERLIDFCKTCVSFDEIFIIGKNGKIVEEHGLMKMYEI